MFGSLGGHVSLLPLGVASVVDLGLGLVQQIFWAQR